MRHEMEHVNEHIHDPNNPNKVGPGTDGDNNPDDDKSDGVFAGDNAVEVEARRAANELRAFYGELQRLDLRNLDIRHPIAVTDPTFFLNVSPIFDLLKSGFNAISISNWLGLLREMFFHQIDPLTLDLNGNGIETLAANGHDGAMFDHERLGIRTATGWVPRQRRHFGVRPQRRRQNQRRRRNFRRQHPAQKWQDRRARL